MFVEHAKVIKAIRDAGEVVGRKKLQKMIYIAKKMNFPFYEKFDFHFYGPYSEELTLRVMELCNLGFINEIKEKKGNYFQYRYTLSEAGNEFLSNYTLDMPMFEECFQNMNNQNARFLELVSTLLFFDKLPKEEVKEKVFTLKSSQHYTVEEIDEAYQYIETLWGKISSSVNV